MSQIPVALKHENLLCPTTDKGGFHHPPPNYLEISCRKFRRSYYVKIPKLDEVCQGNKISKITKSIYLGLLITVDANNYHFGSDWSNALSAATEAA